MGEARSCTAGLLSLAGLGLLGLGHAWGAVLAAAGFVLGVADRSPAPVGEVDTGDVW